MTNSKPRFPLWPRVIAFILGAAALAWGVVLAGVSGQPVPLITAGLLVMALAWLGTNWEEIAAKFGDAEVRVKRVQATAEQAIAMVETVAETSPGESGRIAKAADQARRWIEATVAEDRSHDVDAVQAFQKIYGTLTFRTEAGQPAHVVGWDLATGDVTALSENRHGNLDPGIYRIDDVIRGNNVRLDIEGPVDAPTAVRVSGVPEYDWTVQTDVVLVTPDGRINASNDTHGDGLYPFPEAWGLESRPAWAHVAVISDSIFGGERSVHATATVVGNRRVYNTVGERIAAAKGLNDALD